MGTITQKINELKSDYAEVSSDIMKNLCELAGVSYLEPAQVEALVQSLTDSGHILRQSKYNNEGMSVGQFLTLRKTSGEFVKGYNIYISFLDYSVYSHEVNEFLLPLETELN